jgi:hypothetical protein
VLTRTKKFLLLIAAANLAAVLVGVGVAGALDSRGVANASASGHCTHYTPPYFTGDPSTQPQLCYQYTSVSPTIYRTSSVAVRTSNIESYTSGSWGWQLWYDNGDFSYYCCLQSGTANYATIGGSQGQSKVASCREVTTDAKNMYCTTLW